MKNKRILVTGGLGFLGSNICTDLSKNNEIFIIDKRQDSESLKDFENVKLVVLDLTDQKTTSGVIKEINPEIVYHLAGFTLTDRNEKFIDESLNSNIVGTINVLKGIAEIEVESFVYPSTSEVYGTLNKPPFEENMLPRPSSPYSASKLACEYYCTLYNDTYGLPATILRLFNLYGPYQVSNRFISSCILSLIKGEEFTMTRGEQTREFNYVKDIVNAFVLASLKKPNGEIINIGCGEDHRIIDVAEKILAITGNKGRIAPTLSYRNNDIKRVFTSNLKARNLLGWKPEYKLEEGLRETISWYEEKLKENKNSVYFSK